MTPLPHLHLVTRLLHSAARCCIQLALPAAAFSLHCPLLHLTAVHSHPSSWQTFLQFGLSDLEIRQFFNGPTYLTWSRGQSMQTVGSGPSVAGIAPTMGAGLPRSWMQQQHALQIKILRQARRLGIIGVLPAFQGNLPPQIKRMMPKANISTSHDPKLGDEGNCAWVSSTDPLFGQVAETWMKIMLEDWGTDHW